MEIKELQKLRDKLQDDIRSAIQDKIAIFQTQTGIPIDSIDVCISKYLPIGESYTAIRKVYEVKIDLEL